MTLEVIAAEHNDESIIGRLERYIQHPPQGSKVFTITPGVAEYLLQKYNRSNRSVKPANIKKYVDHMLAQRWALTGDTLKFSDRALLRDGQNRLAACVRSGQLFTTHIVFGIEDQCFDLLDRGKNRDGSDILTITGHTNTRHLAAAVRWAYLFDEGRVKNRDTIDPDRIRHLLHERFPSLPDYINIAQTIHRQSGQPVGLVAAALFMFARRDQGRADAFAAAWANGSYSGRFAPLGKMEKEIAHIASKSSGRIHDVVRAAFIVIAWNDYVRNKRGATTHFRWTLADEFPKIAG